MGKFRGTVRRTISKVGTGSWWPTTARPTCSRGRAGIDQDGAKVEIDGAVDRDAMGFAMTGPTLRVTSGKKVYPS